MQYFVTGNLKHNGQRYHRGDTIELGDKPAAPLLNIGIIQTEALGEDKPQPVPEEASKPQPEVGGKPVQTGEPSIDGQQDQRQGADTAKDLTPDMNSMRALSPDVRTDSPNAPQIGSEAPTEPSETLSRADLEAIAVSEGIDKDTVAAAPNKASLVDLIKSQRSDKPAKPEPVNDPSANL